MEAFEIDLDSECVWLDDAWLNREDLVRKIRGMIDAGEYQIARPSQALEMLTKALAQARLLALRINPDMSDALNAIAAQSGRPVGAVAREAIAAFLASAAGASASANGQAAAGADRVAGATPTPIQLSSTLTTEAVSPEDAANAVALTQKRKDEPEVEKRWFDNKP
jgi:predicted transcriptional regulator